MKIYSFDRKNWFLKYTHFINLFIKTNIFELKNIFYYAWFGRKSLLYIMGKYRNEHTMPGRVETRKKNHIFV